MAADAEMAAVISGRIVLLALLVTGLAACASTAPLSDSGSTPSEPADQPAPTAPSEAPPAEAPRSEVDQAAPTTPAEPEAADTMEPEAPMTSEAPAAEPTEKVEPVEPVAAAPAAPSPAPAPTESAPSDEPAPGLDLSGRLTLTGGEANLEEAVIYFVPDDPAPRASGDDSAARSIVTRGKTLEPTVVSVRPGTELRFPNEDPILHNLFSVSPGNRFDVGIYGPDETPSVSVEASGVINIYCNVHHDMHAHVLVVDTPWRTRPDADGRFELAGLPSGAGTLHAWHRQSEAWSTRVTEPGDHEFDIALEVTRPMLPAHRDKTGQPYNRRDRDPYR